MIYQIDEKRSKNSSEMEEWTENTIETGREGFFSFTMEQCDRLTGDEIFIDAETDVTYMSAYYFTKWKTLNKDSRVTVKNNTVFSCVKIGGIYYPIHIVLKTSFSPLVIGKDFMDENQWTISGDTVSTPHGKLILAGKHPENSPIDRKLAENVFKAEEIQEKKAQENNS